MKLTLVNIYPRDTVARYLLSGYLLKGYLDKYHQGRDLDIEVLNFNENTQAEDLYGKLKERKSDLVGYSCYIWNIEKILEVIKRAREEKEEVIHILGGPEISFQRAKSIPRPSSADSYVIGEGEKKLLGLLDYIQAKKQGLSQEPPKGVAYWEKDELKYSDGCGEDIASLDDIPSVYLNGVIEDNLYEKQQVFLETQRGCIYKCKYCVYHKFFPDVRYYSKERIIQELDHLILNKRVSALRIIDPIFTSDLSRAKEMVRHLSELKNKEAVRLPWIYWEFDYNSVDEEFIKLTASLKYREAICNSDEIPAQDRPQLYSDMLKDYTVINSIGMESFCAEALKAVGRRRINPEKFDIFMKAVNRHNIVLKLDLILGLPFETQESYFKGLEIVLPYFENTDHVLNVHRLQILPGSELEALTAEYGIDYSLNAPHLVFSTNTLTAEEIDFASKLTAVLSRILNSPLRKLFFEARKRSQESLSAMLRKIYSQLCASEECAAARLIKDKTIDDIYWNDAVYREIPSKLIEGLLRNYR